MEKDNKQSLLRSIDFGAVLRTYGIIIGLILIIVVAAILEPTFLTRNNVLNILRNMIVTGLSALGMTYVFMLGMMDLSVGSIISLSGVVCVTLANRLIQTETQDSNTYPIILVAVVLGAIMGAVNGSIITLIKGRLGASFIITYGTQIVFSAAAMLYTGGNFIYGSYYKGTYAAFGSGFLPIWLFLIISVLMQFILKSTKYGKSISFIGANRDCAFMSGLNVGKHIIITFIVSGICSALSGFYVTARIGSGTPIQGNGYELNAIAACVVGGTSMQGGSGSIINTVIGVLVLTVLNNALNVLGIDSNSQLLFRGIIIILSVTLDIFNKKYAVKKG